MKILMIVVAALLLAAAVAAGIARWNRRRTANPDAWLHQPLIAHAGGGIDGHPYTNSAEAFAASYAAGCRLFEFDVSPTSDGRLVARHGWDESLGQKLPDGDWPPAGEPLPYAAFMAAPYEGQYQPLDLAGVLALMRRHRDIQVILDGKVTAPEDTVALYDLLEPQLQRAPKHVRRRLIAQMFYQDDLAVLRAHGFDQILYVVGREPYTAESLSDYCADNGIPAVSLSIYRTKAPVVAALVARGITAFTYTVDDPEDLARYQALGVRGVFTNFLIDDNQGEAKRT
ncbi:glycerophosphodiester phosphodiesterase family protein [Lacticaseibacillus kribbianus]|uniref:glycerophosphodiester phosphodiesterase family protein n=1 Tax=Lacticaseibacillus kribbianus TaxID=2926292 RepID=UPI001CD37D9C|nr:glycerophosphodiester phosphodiesterase family protein [Lacticaseibacillus kribbianus]